MNDFEPSLYEMLGGEHGLRALINRFYDLVDSAPEDKTFEACTPKAYINLVKSSLCSSPAGQVDRRCI